MVTPYWNARVYKSTDLIRRKLYQVAPTEVRKNKYFPDISNSELFDKAYLPASVLDLAGVEIPHNSLNGRISGGRATTLDEVFRIGDQEFKVNIKGSSSRAEVRSEHLYNVRDGNDIAEINPDYRSRLKQVSRKSKTRINGRYIDFIADDAVTERPYGGQNFEWGVDALHLSTSIRPRNLNMLICPTISVPHLKKSFMPSLFRQNNHEQYMGMLGQEIRLLPSNVRLMDDLGIVKLTPKLFEHLNGKERRDFKYNLITSLLQAATVSARTCRKVSGDKYTAVVLDMSAVDRDCAIAADGKAYYTDLESIETKTDFARQFELETKNMVDNAIEGLAPALGYETEVDFVKAEIDTIHGAIPKSVKIDPVKDIDSDNPGTGYVVVDVNL